MEAIGKIFANPVVRAAAVGAVQAGLAAGVAQLAKQR